MAENIVKFRAGDSKRSLGIKKSEFSRCRHVQYLADKHYQHLECRDCGKIVSAWEYVLKLCQREENAAISLMAINNDIANSEEKLANLKKELVSVSGKIRRRNLKI